MKKLEEYSTPISNEASFARWTNHAGIHCKTETDSVPVVVSRDLERKLAMCRDALREIAHCDDLVICGENDHPEIIRRLRFAVNLSEEILETTELK